ncbi:MAG: zinc-ribbon and DUF3426 domain-containing protein [Arenicellales bacterium]
MFTQCPKCQSVFMVSEKDIKAHEGLVRCGNCYSVFNSSWNLTEDPRNDFIEEPASASTKDLQGSGSSGFTFSIVDKAVGPASATGEQPEAADLVKAETTVHEEGLVAGVDDELTPAADLEPFPEPEIDDFHAPSSAPAENNSEENLLYFDSDDEDDIADDEEAEREITPIEDLTILQTPSFTSEISTLDQDNPVLVSELDDKPASDSLTAESMWPGSETKFESDDEFDLQPAGEGEARSEVSEADIETSLPVLPDDETKTDSPIIVEPLAELPEDDMVADAAVASDLPLSATVADELDEESLLDGSPMKDEALQADEEDSWLTAIVAEAVNSESMPPLENSEEETTPELFEEPLESSAADDTFSAAGDVEDADEFFSIDSLPKTDDEAFPLSNEVEDHDESVFITSEEEEVDEAYVPITLKEGEQDELFHGLDEFPEPGELSALNYEDTMEINSMLEEANISKEQIESALSAAEVGEDEEHANGDIEEIFLSSDADNDLTEALFPSDEKGGSDLPVDKSRKEGRTKSVVSYIKHLMPLGLWKKTAWKEPVMDDDQTQLIKSLNRGRNQPELPLWVGKYSLLAIISVLVITLLGQLGYFYMDKLVRITPLRPLLEAGCRISGCTVPEVQNIGEIDQLSSRLTPLAGRDGGFKVSSILVNRDIRSQSFPALELTLTDRAGNMISRRVVTRDKYLAIGKPAVMMPNEAADINIRFRTPSIRVDGFELRPVSQRWLER